MSYQMHEQYINSASGFHIIELRDEYGNKHILQIAVGADSCPACGAVHPKTNLGELDPKAAAATAIESLNASLDAVLAYAKKHGLVIK